jgi:hypothetical protein
VSVDFDPSKQRWRVRWREDGKQRSRRFATEVEAIAFDEGRIVPAQGPVRKPARAAAAEGDAIYPYETNSGLRYRFVFRQSDGTLSSRRGFVSRRVAATARRKLMESIDRREVTVCREEFGGHCLPRRIRGVLGPVRVREARLHDRRIASGPHDPWRPAPDGDCGI